MSNRQKYLKIYRSSDEYKEKRKKYDKKYHSSEKWQKIIEELKKDPERKQKRNDYQKKYLTVNNELNKKIIVWHYTKGSMKCMCPNCPETRYEFLTIEHIKGRKNSNHSKNIRTYSLYVWILKNNFPEDIEILCFNCNITRGWRGSCPHERELQA